MPNHVAGGAETIADHFDGGSATSVVSNRLRFGDVRDWGRAADGTFKVLADGGTVSMNVWTFEAAELQKLHDAFRRAGFSAVTIHNGSARALS